MSIHNSNSNESSINRYIYKLTLKSNKTYIGQRTYYCKYGNDALSDTYRGSSTYIKSHPEDEIINREILIENIKDSFTLNLLETICIQHEIAYNKENCCNKNLGGYTWNNNYQSTKGVPKTKEHIEHARIANINSIKNRNDETKKKISNMARKEMNDLWKNPEYRKMQSESHKGKESANTIYWKNCSTNEIGCGSKFIKDYNTLFSDVRNYLKYDKINNEYYMIYNPKIIRKTSKGIIGTKFVVVNLKDSIIHKLENYLSSQN